MNYIRATGTGRPAKTTGANLNQLSLGLSKHTVKANQGQFTTVRAKCDLPTGLNTPQAYVYLYHILEYKDNDMIRAFTVAPYSSLRGRFLAEPRN